MFKVIIAGSRSFNDYSMLKRKMDNILSNIADEIEIVSGTAEGADTLGERYAHENGLRVKRMPAQWSMHGRKAGVIRNEAMAKYVAPDGGCVVFWLNNSIGSGHMIDIARRYNLKLRIIMV